MKVKRHEVSISLALLDGVANLDKDKCLNVYSNFQVLTKELNEGNIKVLDPKTRSFIKSEMKIPELKHFSAVNFLSRNRI